MINWPHDKIMAIAVPFIKQWEGCQLAPYLDSAGIPTIGIGTTLYPNGKPVTMADLPITVDLANYYLQVKLEEKERALAAIIRQPVWPFQAAAMLSLAYNIGTQAFRKSTVLRAFNTGFLQAAADAFLLWDKAHIDGRLVEVEGLHNRRKAERDLFLGKAGVP